MWRLIAGLLGLDYAVKVAEHTDTARIKASAAVMALMIGLTLSLIYQYSARLKWARKQLAADWRRSKEHLRTAWTRLSPANQIAFALTVLAAWACGLGMAYALPLTADEANVYLTLVSRGPLTAYLYYPFPSNHPLTTIFSAVLDFLSPSPTFSLRLPSVVCFMLLVPVMGLIFARRWGIASGLGVMAGLVALPGILLYAALGRGYLPLTCVVLWHLHFATLLGYRGARLGYVLHWVLSGVIGLWIMPLMLYPLVASAAWWMSYALMRADYFSIRRGLSGLLIILGMALLMYLPSSILSGSPFRFYGEVDEQIGSAREMFGHISFVLEFLSPYPALWFEPFWPHPQFGQPFAGILVLILAFAALFHPRTSQFVVFGLWLAAVMGFVFPLLQGFFPPEKAYIWLAPLVLGVPLAVAYRLGPWVACVHTAILFIAAGFNLHYVPHRLYMTHPEAYAAPAVAQAVKRLDPPNFYCGDPTLAGLLMYYLQPQPPAPLKAPDRAQLVILPIYNCPPNHTPPRYGTPYTGCSITEIPQNWETGPLQVEGYSLWKSPLANAANP